MKMLKVLFCVGLFGVLSAQTVMACDDPAKCGKGAKGPQARHDMMADVFRELDLTADQKKAFKELHSKNKDQGARPPQKIAERIKSINGLVFDGASEQEIEAQVDLLKADYISMSKKAAEFRGILTPEQQARMKELRAKKEHEWRERKEQFGQKFRGGPRGSAESMNEDRQGQRPNF